jgi:hypothetical protein
MQLYNASKSSLTLAGTTYCADERGIIEVPDHAVDSTVWGKGFTVATGRITQLAREAEAAQIADESPDLAALPQPVALAAAIPAPVESAASVDVPVDAKDTKVLKPGPTKTLTKTDTNTDPLSR